MRGVHSLFLKPHSNTIYTSNNCTRYGRKNAGLIEINSLFMTYDTFLRIVIKLKEYIQNHNSIMCSPTKIQKHLIPGLSFYEAQNITQHYRLCIKGRYTLDRLVILIILYKYTTNIILENCAEEKVKLHSLLKPCDWYKPNKCVTIVEEFMSKY